MNYWYFRFEGRFPKGSPEHGCKGVFSSCLVPEANYENAKLMFLHALKENEIELLELIEHFSVNGDELDSTDEKNTFWIKLYNDARKEKEPVFDAWHVFD